MNFSILPPGILNGIALTYNHDRTTGSIEPPGTYHGHDFRYKQSVFTQAKPGVLAIEF